MSATGFPLFVGGTAKQQDVLGDIAEIVVVRGSLVGADLSNMEAYLAAKYRL